MRKNEAPDLTRRASRPDPVGATCGLPRFGVSTPRLVRHSRPTIHTTASPVATGPRGHSTTACRVDDGSP